MRRIITVTLSNNKSETMRGNTAIRQYLLDNGFKVAGSCNCGGSYTLKMEYDTTHGMIRIHAKHSNFLFAKPGENFTKHPISELKNKIDEVKRDYEAFTPAPKG